MIKVKFVTPEGTYKEVESSILNVTSTDGQRGILPNHMPIVLMLLVSRLETIENGKKQEYSIGGGMLYFEDNVATILVDSIESQEEIDLNRALEAKTRAENYLKSNDSNIDLKRASLALARALNRISVANYK